MYEMKRYVMVHLKDERSSPQYQLQKYYPNTFKVLQQRQFNMMQDCILKNLQKGIDQGIYRDNLDPDFIIRIYFSGVNAIKNVDLFPPKLNGIIDIMDNFLEYHLRGIVSPKGLSILNEALEKHKEN